MLTLSKNIVSLATRLLIILWALSRLALRCADEAHAAVLGVELAWHVHCEVLNGIECRTVTLTPATAFLSISSMRMEVLLNICRSPPARPASRRRPGPSVADAPEHRTRLANRRASSPA